jgi:hypothetical protein
MLISKRKELMIYALLCFQGEFFNLILSGLTIGSFLSPVMAGVIANYYGF